MAVHTLNPAEPVVVDDDGSFGGFTDIARRLNARHPESNRLVSRQLVHRWSMKSYYNGFPGVVNVRTRSGKIKPWYILAEVDEWYDSYRQHRRYSRYDRAEEAPIDTIPLFDVDGRGSFVVLRRPR